MQACASEPTKKPDQWIFEENAIHFEIRADSQLNIYEGLPHSVPVCFYQLHDKDFFKKLTLHPEGINRLLECRAFHTSVARTYRLTIDPNDRKRIVMNREKGVKFIAVVAGYFMKDNKNIIHVYDIPVIAERPALIKSTETVKPGPLNVRLTFGPEQIE